MTNLNILSARNAEKSSSETNENDNEVENNNISVKEFFLSSI